MRLEGLDVEEELSFVVHGPTREDFSVANRRLEWRRMPEIERLGRLYVVVAVDEHRRCPRRAAPLADDDRVAGRLMHTRLEAHSAHRIGHPVRRARGVGGVLGTRTDA